MSGLTNLLLERRHENRFYAFLCGGVSIFLAVVAAWLAEQEYAIAVNPRVTGHIERTWVVVRGRDNQHVRVADFTFTMSQAGKPVVCRAEGQDIGGETFAAQAGDSIELSPLPNTCRFPHVLNVRPPTWGEWTLIGSIVGASLLFAVLALLAWG
jgi:hypothetical protein